MNSLRDGFRAAGLVSDGDVSQFEKRKDAADNGARYISWVETVADFSRVASEVLTIYPEKIDVIIELARDLKIRKGRGKLLWQLHQIKTHLPGFGTSKARQKFLEEAFGENGAGYLAVMRCRLHGD